MFHKSGNGGSYKQVRSLASVALRKAIEDSDYEVHFDYFSIDFNEEQMIKCYPGKFAYFIL